MLLKLSMKSRFYNPVALFYVESVKRWLPLESQACLLSGSGYFSPQSIGHVICIL